jgi:hypothetical protein
MAGETVCLFADTLQLAAGLFINYFWKADAITT